jgi:hypothetical protein
MFASGAKAVASSPPVLTDRGEHDAWDYEIGDLVTDGSWNVIDFSSVVGAARRLVCVRFQWASTNPSDYFQIRTNYGASVVNQSSRRTQVAAATQEADIFVVTDAEGKVEFSCANAVFTTIRVGIRYWWSIP